MPARVAVVAEQPERAVQRCPAVEDAEVLLDWRTARANVAVDLGHLPSWDQLPEAARDLLELAVAVYAADIAVRRGDREQWPRDISLSIPVRLPTLWASCVEDLSRLIFALTRDSFRLDFYPAPELAEPSTGPESDEDLQPDCVCMLSGGIDSLAGAVTLQQSGRRPIYSLHRSGNPAVLVAQERSLEAVEAHWPGQSVACPYTVAPDPRGADALPFPPAEEREPSRRARSLLFMAAAAVTAHGAGVDEAYMCENGLLTAGLPLAPSRAGSMSTHSTHPAALKLFNTLAERAGVTAQVANPFIYQTKADLIRDVLRPHLSPQDIQSTVSCWAVGRTNRQCGGCIPCLLRRIGMAYAELPEEAYMIDLLGQPEQYMGTDAYGNLVDLLRHAQGITEQSDAEIIAAQPAILALRAAGMDISEISRMLRRHAEQMLSVLRERYPRAAALIR
ncbi:MAG: 7-cyano-7-deazaguanine synthase [Armatimonadota bacterium]|nr:7-cyano-7-deazaguanine synthase [Armatimonadota bacterium]